MYDENCADILNPGHKVAEIWDALGPVKVYENKFQRYITFGSVFEQSFQSKSDPGLLMHEHTRAMMLPLVFHNPGRVAILGLGGGSLANCLYDRFPDMQLVAVEHRQVVIDIAHQYFKVPLTPELTIHREDANEFVERAEPGTTDLLLCDLYNAHGINAIQCNPLFLSQCHAMLKDDGWIAFNYFSGHRETNKALKFLARKFESLLVCELCTGNLIVMAAKKAPDLESKTLFQRATQLEKHLGFPLVDHFLHLSWPDRKGRHLPIFAGSSNRLA